MATRKGARWQETPQLAGGAGVLPTRVSAPVDGFMLNVPTDSVMCSARYRNLPLGSTVIPMGVVPVFNGEFTAVSAPVLASIMNVEMLLGESPPVLVLVTYKNVPEGLTVIPKGLLAANGDPGTGVSAPLELLMLKAEMLPLSFPTKTNLPAGSTATP